jgi:2-polyprenyl-6-hydroxyphenyl methylase/3-demethylubiquinone-9 3-methyltransferase
MINLDPDEIGKFEQTAAHWWDPNGPLRTLHDINALRLDYVRGRCRLAGAAVLDIGCGGGILAEALARQGAVVIGIDGSAEVIRVAAEHCAACGLRIDYRQATAEQLAAAHPTRFDVVTCMELLEHVPEPRAVVEAAARLVSPRGSLFFSTINRSLTAYCLAVVGAEYVLGLLPRGTHDYRRFIRPSELAAWAREAGFEIADLSGIRYQPFARRATLAAGVEVNYIVHAVAAD